MEVVANSSPTLNLTSICRICMKTDNLLNICGAQCSDTKLEDIFENVLHEKLKGDNITKNLCIKCIELLVQFHYFLNLYTKTKSICDSYLEAANETDVKVFAGNNDNPDPLVATNNSTTENLKIKEEFVDLKEIGDSKEQSDAVKSRTTKSVVKKSDKHWDRKYILRECCICNYKTAKELKQTSAQANLKRHYFSEHSIRVNVYQLKCLKCKGDDVTFNRIEDIQEHCLRDEHSNLMTTTVEKEEKTNSDLNDSYEYKCLPCKLELETFEDVLAHYMEAGHGSSSRCMLCRKIDQHPREHLSSHKPDRLKYFCHKCLLPFNDANELLHHNELEDHSKLRCQFCNKFIPVSKVKRHLRVHKSNKGKQNSAVCHICGQTFYNKFNLRRHVRVRHEGKRFQCSHCSISYTVKALLQRHIKRVHENNKLGEEAIDEEDNVLSEKQIDNKANQNKAKKEENNMIVNENRGYILCEICGKSLYKYDKQKMRLHQAFHESGHKLICLALGCEMMFPDKTSRLNHLVSDHKQIACNECKGKRIFYDEVSFKVHTEWHFWNNCCKDFPENKPVCRICKVNFNTFAEVAKHLKDMHLLYMCIKHKACNYQIFTTKHTYNQHTFTKFKRPKGESYHCKICNRQLNSKANLLAHERGHSKVRTHKCVVCNHMFATTGQLKVHSRIHSGERPYPCRFCVKKFTTIHNRKLHERLHTGEKPYECGFCSKRFADGSGCRQHMATHRK